MKVLDFGLAKIPEAAPADTDPENSPTFTLEQATRVGAIIGTAAYMSPEQARGKTVDKRADIWAFAQCCTKWSPARGRFPVRQRGTYWLM